MGGFGDDRRRERSMPGWVTSCWRSSRRTWLSISDRGYGCNRAELKGQQSELVLPSHAREHRSRWKLSKVSLSITNRCRYQSPSPHIPCKSRQPKRTATITTRHSRVSYPSPHPPTPLSSNTWTVSSSYPTHQQIKLATNQ